VSIPGKKDVLAAGGRKMILAGGIGDSPLLERLKTLADGGEIEEPVITFDPTPKAVEARRKFNPNPGVYLIRQTEAKGYGFANMEEALQSSVDKSKVIAIQEETNKEQPAEGVIVEAGNGTIHSVGTYVAFGKYAGTQFKLNGETLLFMKDEDIFGSITSEEFGGVDVETEITLSPGVCVASA
jgi:chaperonin GroES